MALLTIQHLPSYDTQDSLYDLAWSEQHEHQLVTGSGDGSLKLWDVTLSVGRERVSFN